MQKVINLLRLSFLIFFKSLNSDEDVGTGCASSISSPREPNFDDVPHLSYMLFMARFKGHGAHSVLSRQGCEVEDCKRDSRMISGFLTCILTMIRAPGMVHD